MKFEYSKTISTAASIEKVFEFATSVESRILWQKHLSKVELLSEGPIKIGTQFKDIGKGGEMILEFTEFNKNKHIRYSTVKGKGMFVDLSWDFEKNSDKTEVFIKISMQPKGLLNLLWPILGPLLIIPQVKNDFSFLEKYLKEI